MELITSAPPAAVQAGFSVHYYRPALPCCSHIPVLPSSPIPTAPHSPPSSVPMRQPFNVTAPFTGNVTQLPHPQSNVQYRVVFIPQDQFSPPAGNLPTMCSDLAQRPASDQVHTSFIVYIDAWYRNVWQIPF